MTAVCLLATSRPAYAFAVRQAVLALLAHTPFDVIVGCDDIGALLLPEHPRVTTIDIAAPPSTKPGDRFLAKFALFAEVLASRADTHFLMVDSDAVLVSTIGDDDVAEALGGKMIGMAEQPGTIPDGTTREDLYRHYRNVTFAALGAGPAPAPSDRFRYYNSGIVLFSREGLETFLDWYWRHEKRAAFGDFMIADQDYLQIFANEVLPGDVAELPGHFNHSPLWHEDYPRDDAVFCHLSNYCNAPDPGGLLGMLALNQARIKDVAVARGGGNDTTTRSVTVIVVTYNSARTLPLCLDLLAGQDCRIIVVDNGSSDTSREIAEKAGARVISNPANLGFAKACNIGAAAAETEILCFLNPDCLLDRKTVSEAIRRIEHQSAALYVPGYIEWSGGRVEGRQPGYTRLKLLADVLETTRLRRLTRRLRRMPAIDDRSWHWPLAACLFVHRDTFREVGGFDESLWLYMEDVRLGEDAARHGIPTLDLGRHVIHFGAMGSSTTGMSRTEILVSGRLRYAEKRYGKRFARFLALLYKATTGNRGAGK